MKARFLWPLVAAIGAAGVGCASPRTEILLVVGADLSVPDDIDHVMIRASGATSDGGFAQTYDVTQTETPLPLSLGLLAASGHAGPLHVDVVGLKGVTKVVARSATTSFVEGKVLVLHIDLLRACASVMCPDAKETCIAGACSSDAISGSSLPTYTGSLTSDGGAGGRRADASPDLGRLDADAADARDDTPIDTAADAVARDVADEEAAGEARADTPIETPADAVARDVADEEAAGDARAPTITVGPTQETPLQGYDGAEATNFQDACPKDSLVIGYEESTDNNVVAQLQTMCGVPSVSPDGSTVLVTPGATLILRGGVTAPLVASLCPANQVVVGFDGRAFALLDQLSVRCAPLTISGQTLSVGAVTNLAPLGGDGGQPFARTDCGAGMVAVGTNVALRNWVSGFGLVCAGVGVK